MPRVTRKEAEQHREDVVEAAARLFREHGIDGTSVPELMAAAGLTHGAFYGHFSSKEELAAEACERAFAQGRAIYDEIERRHGADKDAARLEFIKNYTSRLHRDRPELGCPAPAIGGEIARSEFKGSVRAAFVAGVEAMALRLQTLLSRKPKKPLTRERTLAVLAMLVGAQMLARSTKGHAVSDEVLLAVRNRLLEE